MADFGSFWIGGPINGPLTKLQWLSLSSYIYYGHTFTLFVYDENLSVPYGVVKKDAREIMREDEVFYAKGYKDGLGKGLPAPSADIFRYRMLNKYDLIWSDCDMVCLTDDFSFFTDGYLFSIEKSTNCVNGDLLKFPIGSEPLTYLIEQAEAYPKDKIQWGDIGPFLLTTVVNRFNLVKYNLPSELIHTLENEEWGKYWKPEHLEEVLSRCNNAKTASLYNALATYHKMDKNNFPHGSALEYFYNRFV